MFLQTSGRRCKFPIFLVISPFSPPTPTPNTHINEIDLQQKGIIVR